VAGVNIEDGPKSAALLARKIESAMKALRPMQRLVEWMREAASDFGRAK